MNLQNSEFDKNSTYFEHSLDTSGIPTVFMKLLGTYDCFIFINRIILISDT